MTTISLTESRTPSPSSDWGVSVQADELPSSGTPPYPGPNIEFLRGKLRQDLTAFDLHHLRGYCYSLLLRPDRRAELCLDLGPDPHPYALLAAFVPGGSYDSSLSPSKFSFTVSPFTSHPGKQRAHIAERNAGLRAVQVLQLLASSVAVGVTAMGGEEVEADHAALPTLPSGNFSPYIGTLMNPSVRRMEYRAHSQTLRSTKASKDAAPGIVEVYTHSLTPHQRASVVDWLRYSSVASFTSLQVKLQPGPAASLTNTTLRTAWIPHTDAAPASITDFDKLQTNEIHMFMPHVPGGRVEPLLVHCGFDANVQQRVKPLPLVGGYPVFCYYADLDPLLNPSTAKPMPLSEGEVLFHVTFVLTISLT